MNDRNWPLMTEPLPLADDIVHVVRLDLNADPSRTERLRSTLSFDELTRADRYKFDEPRRRFIVCRAALRQLLGSCLAREPASLIFVYGPHGKPMLESNAVGRDGSSPAASVPVPVEFGVSHSADLALIAITRGRRVGVDVEQHDAKVRILKLAGRFFSPCEAAVLASLPECDQLAGFYRGWTGKEAYLKATGFGLSFPLNQFDVELNPREPAGLLKVADQPDEAARWRMHSLDVVTGFSAALLIEADTRESVGVRQWSFSGESITGVPRVW